MLHTLTSGFTSIMNISCWKKQQEKHIGTGSIKQDILFIGIAITKCPIPNPNV